ncbi:SH3 domain-containing protein [Streptomyces sp. NBC_01384]|uniref:SH3 domain-containing protein n=1 Tax=Streptomyces sp. NBC_01384 TaxID=2903847 RepID=UPI003254794A
MISRILRGVLVAAIAAVAVFPVTAVASAAPATHVPGRGTPPSPAASSSWYLTVPQSSVPSLPGPQRAPHTKPQAPIHHHRHPVAHHARHHVTRHVTGRVTTHHLRLHVRSGPGTGYRIIGSLRTGRVVTIICKKQGSNILGNRRWYKLGHHKGYVSAYYVRNRGVVRWC